MKKMIVAAFAFALLGSTAQAASLTNKTYTTARKAALGGAAYAFNKAYKGGLYNTRNIKIARVLDDKGASQKFLVKSNNGVRSKVVTVKRDSANVFRAYIPASSVRTPGGSFRNN